MSVTDILRKEAHELMNSSPENKERIRLCIDGDMEGYLQTFKTQIKSLTTALEISEEKYFEMRNQFESTAKQLDGMTMILDQTSKMLESSEKQSVAYKQQFETVAKQLEEERNKKQTLEDMFIQIKKAMNTNV